jgi:hypothetical protein
MPDKSQKKTDLKPLGQPVEIPGNHHAGVCIKNLTLHFNKKALLK